MKKRVLSGAALAGLFLLGAATTFPQDPGAGEPVARQTEPPSFRDVLRGKVGQKCEVEVEGNAWKLSFWTDPDWFEGLSETLQELREQMDALQALREGAGGVNRDWVTQHNSVSGQMRRVADRERRARTLAAIGADFIQLREADGTEQFVRLARVDVVVVNRAK